MQISVIARSHLDAPNFKRKIESYESSNEDYFSCDKEQNYCKNSKTIGIIDNSKLNRPMFKKKISLSDSNSDADHQNENLESELPFQLQQIETEQRNDPEIAKF